MLGGKHVTRIHAPFVVDRADEIAELEQALSGTRERRGRAVFLVGEEGSGKSRLVREVVDKGLAEGMYVLRGRATAAGPAVALRPFTEALLGFLRDGGLPQYERRLGPYLKVLGQLIPEFPVARGDYSHVVLAEAVLRLVSVLGEEAGCAIVLEDLHDADPQSLAVVEYLADNLDRQPAALIATVRPGPGAAMDLALAAEQRGSGLLVRLDGLDRAGVRRLVAACLGVRADGVPDEVADSLWEESAGNPLLVEDLLSGLIRGGVLVHPDRSGDWKLAGEPRAEASETLARATLRRAGRLGPQGHTVLSAAAVLGRRFPLDVLQAVTGLDEPELLSCMQAGMAGHLLVADELTPDHYVFRHPLTVRALRRALTPAGQAALAQEAANAVEKLHPGLPGDWCQAAAVLRQDAGDPVAAARLLCQAGGRALAVGDLRAAISTLGRARELLDGTGRSGLTVTVTERLVDALVESGELDRAGQLVDALDDPQTIGAQPRRLVALRCSLAVAAARAGRHAEGEAWLAAARSVLPSGSPARWTAPVAAAAAHLAWRTPGPDRYAKAEALAREAADAAEGRDLAVVACQSWELLGLLALEQGTGLEGEFFERVAVLARAHRLPFWQLRAALRLGAVDWLATGDDARLVKARLGVARLGAARMQCEADAMLAFQKALAGDFEAAARLVRRCRTDAIRLSPAGGTRLALLVEAVLAAHRAQRQPMERALAEFADRGGDESSLRPLATGVARVFCALLEEDRARARSELAEAVAHGQGGRSLLTGDHGVFLLLDALSGDLCLDRFRSAAYAPAGRLRWNRQFVLLAQAVLLGRAGRAEEAAAAVAEARDAAAPFAMAGRLGLRLVAEAASADGWGDPQEWLRDAEDYFHQLGVPAPARACRALLRQAGVIVVQRRDGVERIPPRLRLLGITAREYEVFGLLTERLGNQNIATRLYISPRTVEKHVASLIMKTGMPDRAALQNYTNANVDPRRGPADDASLG